MSLAFCARCGASTGKAHAYHKADGSIVCHDCQHRENVDRIQARRKMKPVASIGAALIVVAAGGGYAAWRFLTEPDRDATAYGANEAEWTLSQRVAHDVLDRQRQNPALSDDDALAATIAAFRESGHVPKDFDENLLRAGAVEALDRLR